MRRIAWINFPNSSFVNHFHKPQTQRNFGFQLRLLRSTITTVLCKLPFFKRYFYVSFDILISMSRTVLIFLLTHPLMFGECSRNLLFMLLPFEMKISFKNGKNSDLWRRFKIMSGDFFERHFYVFLISKGFRSMKNHFNTL